MTTAVHAKGGKIVLQLWQTGRFSHIPPQEGGQAPVAPSAIQAGELTFLETGMERPSMPRALATDETPGIVADYVTAARNARTAGFDGVEVHAANCYLLDQFIRDSTNKRTERYGGSAENRTRLTVEVGAAVADAIGADRVGVGLSPITKSAGDTPFDSDPQATYGFVADRLGELNLAYLHCVEGQTRGDNSPDAFDFQALRRSFGGAYIANNGFDRGRPRGHDRVRAQVHSQPRSRRTAARGRTARPRCAEGAALWRHRAWLYRLADDGGGEGDAWSA